MPRKEQYIARLEEVIITREGEYAIVQYKEEGIMTTHLKIGPEVAGLSDEAILELFNDTLRAQAQLAAEYKHVAVEVPLGSPQIKYFARGDQWCPRGGVLRCLVEDDENGHLVVEIDDQRLSLEEFGSTRPKSCGEYSLRPSGRLIRQSAMSRSVSRLVCSP